MFCTNCGTELKDDQKFCPKCGTRRLSIPAAAAAKVPEVAEVPKVAEVPEVAEVPKVAEVPRVAEVPEPVEVSKAMEVQDVPSTVEAPEAPETAEVKEAAAEVEIQNVQQPVAAPVIPQAGVVPPPPPVYNAPNAMPAKASGIKRPNLSKLKGLWNKKTKTTVIALASAAAALALVFFVIGPLVKSLKGTKERNVVFYIDDQKLYALDADDKKAEPVQLSSTLYTDDYSEEGVDGIALFGTRYLKSSNTVLFVDNIDEDYGYSLKSLKFDKNADEAESTKIGSGIEGGYILTSDEKRVFYMNKDGEFYCYDFKEGKRIAKDVEGFTVNEDGSFIAYVTEDDELYSVNSKSLEADKVDEDIEYSESISISMLNGYEGAHTDPAFTYFVDDSLYVLLKDGQKKKIMDYDYNEYNDLYILHVDEKGRVIYTVEYNEMKSDTMYDFIDDDMAQSDSQFEKPDRNDRKYWKDWDYDWWGDPIVYEYTDEYYALCSDYEEKEKRDSLREELESYSLGGLGLYYFDGNDVKKIGDYLDFDIEDFYDDASMYIQFYDDNVIFMTADPDGDKKIKMSDVYDLDISVYEMFSNVREELEESGYKYYISKAGDVRELKVDSMPDRLQTNNKNTSLYFLEDGDLYKVDFNGGESVTPEPVYTDVADYFFNDKGELITARNPEYDEDEFAICDLYVNDKKIDSDVWTVVMPSEALWLGVKPLFAVCSSDGTLFYRTDWDESEETVTVMQYDGKDTKKLAKEVTYFCPVAKDKLLYIDNYSYNTDGTEGGDLRYLNGDQTERLGRDAWMVFNKYGARSSTYRLDYFTSLFLAVYSPWA